MGLIDRFKKYIKKQDSVNGIIPVGGERPDLRGISQIGYFQNGYVYGWFGQKYSDGLPFTTTIFKNYKELRNQARKSHLESTETRSIVGRIADLAIHTGLRMQSTPEWYLIDPNDELSNEDRRKFTKNIEARWKLYFESKECDSTGQWAGGQIQHFVKTRMIVDGEVLAVIRKDESSNRMSPIALQFYNVDQLGSASDDDLYAVTQRKNYYKDGIEYDNQGRTVAYFISGVRVPKYSPNGDLWVIHYFEREEPGQMRGISRLSPILHDLSKLTGYKVAELQAAVMNASIAAWVKPGNAPSSRPLMGIARKSEFQSIDLAVDQTVKQAQLTQPGIFVQNLKANEELVSYDTKRPNVNFDLFVKAMMKYLGGSMGMPVEVIELTFNQNYSASRATLILAWRMLEIEREKDNNGFNRPWFESWFMEEVRKGNIIANGLESPVIRNAWIKTDWVGIAKPDIDPNKTAMARKQNLDLGLTTHERESLDHNGTEFDENIALLEDENIKLAKVNIPINSDIQNAEIQSDGNTDNATTANN